MRAKRLVVSSSLLFVVVACSSATPGTTSEVVLPSSGAGDPVAPSTPGASNANALVYFDGAVDTVRGVMNLVVRDASGTIKSESTLPYGDNPGQVYMHTCTSGYSSGTHQLTGNVQAVNLMLSGTVTSMNAVVDSISVTGVTLASGSGAGGSSGIIASYGTVPVNTPNCASTQPWAFQNLAGDPSFTFKGHVDGTPQTSFPSTGAEGAFAPSSSVVLAPGVHNFTTITIPTGVTVTTSGVGVLDLRATGNVNIAGTINVSGGAGGNAGSTGNSSPPGSFGTGGATGAPTAGVTLSNQNPIASIGGGGAKGGGDPGNNVQAANGGGTGGKWDYGGGGGGGFAGGGAGGCNCGTTGGAGGSFGGGTGGAGGPSSQPGKGGVATGVYAGVDGSISTTCSGAPSSAGAGGGGSIGAPAAGDLAVATTLQSGSAGGGGGSPCSSQASGGGGGGGGGGALRVATVGTLTVTGSLLAMGGSGGAAPTPGNGGGGGGSGGVIFLYAPQMSVSGNVSAIGGSGGTSPCGVNGGAGGLGRIRISATTTSCTLGGTFNPPLASGCGAANAAGQTYVAAYPN